MPPKRSVGAPRKRKTPSPDGSVPKRRRKADQKERPARPIRHPEQHPSWPNLNERQRAAIQAVWIDQKPLTLLGSAGTGKSYVLAVLLWLGALVTATTASAALNVGGKTIDSLLGLNPDDLDEPDELCSSRGVADESERVQNALNAWRRRKNVFALAAKLLQAPQCTLVIDEFSMLGRCKAAFISAVMQDAVHCMKDRRAQHPHLDPAKPFGGVRMVFVGDPFQLEPVCDSPIFDAPTYKALFHADFCEPGMRGTTILLTENYRQGSHTVFIHLLECIRFAWMTPLAWFLLLLLEDRAQQLPSSAATELYSKNDRVDAVNDRKLKDARLNPLLVEGAWKTEKIRRGVPVEIGQPIVDGGPVVARIVEKMKPGGKSKPLPRMLQLAVGAPVRFTRNLPFHKTLGPVVTNGTIGRVLSVAAHETHGVEARILLPDGRTRVVYPVGVAKRMLFYADNTDRGAKPDLNDEFVQLPLRLAYASTIYGVQGVSMLAVSLEIDPSFSPWGNMYVALSRATTMRNIIARGVVAGAKALRWTPRIDQIMRQTGFDVSARRRALDEESERWIPRIEEALKQQEQIDVSKRWDRLLVRMRTLFPDIAGLFDKFG